MIQTPITTKNVVDNDFPNDNDSYHSEELRSPISTDDEGD